ncbi:helix-turn-helix domain-containing protein [Aeromicrobium alkaliterrae]
MTLTPAHRETSARVAERARAVRRNVPEVAAAITRDVRASIPRYDAPGTRRVLDEAVSTALHRFLDAVDGAPHRDRGVEELFRTLGLTEARAGHSLSDLRAAVHIAVSCSWQFLRRTEAESGSGQPIRSDIADAVIAFADHLVAEADAGHAEGARRRDGDSLRARARLAESLLTGAPTLPDDHDAWPVPSTVLVAVVELPDGERPDLSALGRTALIVREGDRLVILADSAHREQVVETVAAAGTGRIGLATAPTQSAVPAAFRWGRRVLQMVQRGVIPEARVVDAADHLTQVWLHAEPGLRQALVQEKLKPLLAETPNSREILSETLLVWLETRDSAPAIAAHLGVHPQTVRYRWKRINELFGEALREPEFIVQITMILKASVPLWKAGDQSDFERFQTSDQA